MVCTVHHNTAWEDDVQMMYIPYYYLNVLLNLPPPKKKEAQSLNKPAL